MTHHFVTVQGVLEEAEFYNITSLIKLIKEKIRERDCKTSQVSEFFFSVFDCFCANACLSCVCFLLSGSSETRLSGPAVPGGRADTDGVHNV